MGGSRNTLLRPRDEMVLKALVCHPDRSDRDLSSSVGISKSSICAIRKRLFDSCSVIRTCIPAVWRLGWEVLTIRVIENTHPITRWTNDPGRFPGLDHDLFAYFDLDTSIGISAYPNVAGWKMDRSRLSGLFPDDQNFRSTFIDMPLSDMHIYNMLDYSGILHCSHGCSRSMIEKSTGTENVRLDILRSIVKMACSSKGGVSDNQHVHVGSVNRYRKRYREEGLILDRNIPIFPSIGKKVLCLIHLDLTDRSPSDLREIERGISNISLMNLESNYEQVIMTVHDDLGSSVMEVNRLIDDYYRRDLIRRRPKVYRISTEDPRPPIMPEKMMVLLGHDG